MNSTLRKLILFSFSLFLFNYSIAMEVQNNKSNGETFDFMELPIEVCFEVIHQDLIQLARTENTSKVHSAVESKNIGKRIVILKLVCKSFKELMGQFEEGLSWKKFSAEAYVIP